MIGLLALAILVSIVGCTGKAARNVDQQEKAAINEAALRYLNAEVMSDFKEIYRSLAPSSTYCRENTYEDYLTTIKASPVRVLDYRILKIEGIRTNEDSVTYPNVKKFAQLKVEVTLLYEDTGEKARVNYDFTFMKEGGKWYKG